MQFMYSSTYSEEQALQMADMAKTSHPAFKTKGACISLNKALEQFHLTMNEVTNANPPIPVQRRCMMGNVYPSVPISCMKVLQEQVKEAKEVQKEKDLMEKLGNTGYQALQEKKADMEMEKEAALERNRKAMKIAQKLQVAVDVSNGKIEGSLEGITVTKTAAKSKWLLKDDDLLKMKTTQEGKTIKYDVIDCIKASEARHGVKFIAKLKSNGERGQMYARYFKESLHEYPKDLVNEAVQIVTEPLKKRLKLATLEFKNAKNAVAAIESMTAGVELEQDTDVSSQ